VGKVRVNLPTEVATWMLNHKREDILQLEQRNQLRIEIDPSDRLLRHEVGFETFPREKVEAPAPRVVGDRVPAVPPSEAEVAPVAQGEAAEKQVDSKAADEVEAPRTRKRRRRRRKAGTDAGPPAEEPADASVAESPPADAEPGGRDLPDGTPAVAEAAESAPATSDESTEADGDGDRAGGKPRRRRRRRRRPRGGNGAGTGGAKERPDADEAAAPAGEVIVPGHVRADELMPAAVGGRKKKPRRESSGGEGRRRRKRSSRKT
jgi:ribonuclease E